MFTDVIKNAFAPEEDDVGRILDERIKKSPFWSNLGQYNARVQVFDPELKKLKTVKIPFYDVWPSSSARGIHPAFMDVVEQGGHGAGWEASDELAIQTWQYGVQSWLLHHFFALDVEGSEPFSQRMGITVAIKSLRRHFQKARYDDMQLLPKLKIIGSYFQHNAAFESLGFCYQKCKQGQDLPRLEIQCQALGTIIRNTIEAWILDSIVSVSKDSYCVFRAYKALPDIIKKIVDPLALFDKGFLGEADTLDPKFSALLIKYTNTLIDMANLDIPEDKAFVDALVQAGNDYFDVDMFELSVQPKP